MLSASNQFRAKIFLNEVILLLKNGNETKQRVLVNSLKNYPSVVSSSRKKNNNNNNNSKETSDKTTQIRNIELKYPIITDNLQNLSFNNVLRKLSMLIWVGCFALKLKAYWQISKKRCSGKYCSCDGACQFSAL